jgi:hypothetical protein
MPCTVFSVSGRSCLGPLAPNPAATTALIPASSGRAGSVVISTDALLIFAVPTLNSSPHTPEPYRCKLPRDFGGGPENSEVDHWVRLRQSFRLWVSRGTFLFSLVPWYPSKSGLLNEHIVNISPQAYRGVGGFCETSRNKHSRIAGQRKRQPFANGKGETKTDRRKLGQKETSTNTDPNVGACQHARRESRD